MDEIKKIIQSGTEVGGSWKGGDVFVIFKDESIEPIRVDSSELYKVYEEYGAQHNMDISDLSYVAENIPDEDIMIADYKKPKEVAAALAEFDAAKEKADSLKKKPATPVTPAVVPPVNGAGTTVPPVNGVGVPEHGEPTTPERGATARLNNKVLSKSSTPKRVLSSIFAIIASGGALTAAIQAVKDYTQSKSSYEHNIDDENSDENANENIYDDWLNINISETEFGRLMNEMRESDLRRQVSEDAFSLVTLFHFQTHKDDNFRLAEDGDVYLDLSIEEATALTISLNYTDPIQLNEILGSYNLDAQTLMELTESAMSKLMTYYMNAKEISGVSGIIHDEESRNLFLRFENDILTFNQMHDTISSDKLIRDLYYTFVLNDQTSADHVPASVKYLIGNMMEAFQLKENASAEHAILFDQYHGLSFEEELSYFVDNYVLKQPGAYANASEEQKQIYRNAYASSLIESGTTLVDMFSNGIVMTEDNSTQEQRDAITSITDIINKDGLCATVKGQLEEAIRNRYSLLNLDNKDNRPGFDQIFSATKSIFSSYDNYFGDLNSKSDQIAVLVNNRRHTAYTNSFDNISGMSPSDIDAFVNEGGTPTNTVVEQVEYDDLTPEEQQQADEQQNVIEAELAKQNSAAQGGFDANLYANSVKYIFSPNTVTNSFNKEVYNLNSMTFASGVAYMYAFNNVAPSVQDSQIQEDAYNSAENYLDSISKENQEAIARGMGTDWGFAREELKYSYMEGYTKQMENEISSAIAEGQRMQTVTKNEEEFLKGENENQQEQEQGDLENQIPPTAPPDEQITEKDVDIPSQPVPGPDGNVPQPEVGDPNIGVQNGEGEIPVGDDYDPEPQPAPTAPEENVVDDTQVVPGIEEPQIEEPSNDLTGDANIDIQKGEDEVVIPEDSYEAEPQPKQVVEAVPEEPTVTEEAPAQEVPTQEVPFENEPAIDGVPTTVEEPAIVVPAVEEQASVVEPVQQEVVEPTVEAPEPQQNTSISEQEVDNAIRDYIAANFGKSEVEENEEVEENQIVKAK